ncbi:hypothetical protein N9A28_02180 [Sulfurimonas sp.]|nr:hypothetical protein [Sulfurimonas sp.]
MKLKLAIFFVFIFTGCAIDKPIVVDKSSYDLIPISAANSFVITFLSTPNPEIKVFSCRASTGMLNETKYANTTFKAVQNFTLRHSSVLETNTGCIVRADKLEDINKLIKALLSLGAKEDSAWSKLDIL